MCLISLAASHTSLPLSPFDGDGEQQPVELAKLAHSLDSIYLELSCCFLFFSLYLP